MPSRCFFPLPDDANLQEAGVLIIRQLEIYGSTGGSIAEFSELLQVYNRGLLRPVIDSAFPLHDIHAAFDRLAKGEQFGKISLLIP
jgi:D-arabinose 1-dehydrogenase-like Zn-dependent alcohol dehydrogenase